MALCLDRVPGVLVNAMADDLRLSIYLEPGATKRDAVFFKPGDAVLFGTSCTVAQAIGDCLVGAVSSGRLERDGDDFQLRVFVEGHTDAVPLGLSLRHKFETNWELSGARAAAVVIEQVRRSVAARGCSALPESAARIQEYVSDRRIVVNAVGLADRRPAWQRICAENHSDPVCRCLREHRGDAEACRTPLQGDAQLEGIRVDLRARCSARTPPECSCQNLPDNDMYICAAQAGVDVGALHGSRAGLEERYRSVRDALGGRCARRLNGPGEVCQLLMSPDERLLEAAQEAGLPVPDADSFTDAAGELLVRWANRPGDASEAESEHANDARRRHQRRVDLRFEIAPRALPDADGGGVD